MFHRDPGKAAALKTHVAKRATGKVDAIELAGAEENGIKRRLARILTGELDPVDRRVRNQRLALCKRVEQLVEADVLPNRIWHAGKTARA